MSSWRDAAIPGGLPGERETRNGIPVARPYVYRGHDSLLAAGVKAADLERLVHFRKRHPDVLILLSMPVPTAWVGTERVRGRDLPELLGKLDVICEHR